jgi:hypothetical protein
LSLIRQRSRVEMAEMMLDLIGNLSDCVLFLAFLSAFFLIFQLNTGQSAGCESGGNDSAAASCGCLWAWACGQARKKAVSVRL